MIIINSKVCDTSNKVGGGRGEGESAGDRVVGGGGGGAQLEVCGAHRSLAWKTPGE